MFIKRLLTLTASCGSVLRPELNLRGEERIIIESNNEISQYGATVFKQGRSLRLELEHIQVSVNIVLKVAAKLR